MLIVMLPEVQLIARRPVANSLGGSGSLDNQKAMTRLGGGAAQTSRRVFAFPAESIRSPEPGAVRRG